MSGDALRLRDELDQLQGLRRGENRCHEIPSLSLLDQQLRGRPTLRWRGVLRTLLCSVVAKSIFFLYFIS